MTPACQYLSDATDTLIEEFDALISRNFASDRTISVSHTLGGEFVAVIDGRVIFPPTPNLDTVIRFVRAFAIQTAGVTVDEDSVEYHRAERAFGHSVRVDVLSGREGETLASRANQPEAAQSGQPSRSESASNVVPIRTPA
jgi:hypothetical protein